MDCSGGSPKADHLCVLVHGLWGKPDHMATIAKKLRAQHSSDELHLLLAQRNKGSFTYDGIELGGERVCAEIEEELRQIESRGGKVKKLSIVGYSLGGLVSRYALGLLYARGLLDGLECMNFTTFATPHLGVRSPVKGWASHLWNVIGARTLSESGRQLFTIDNFRDTGRPLLSVISDPDSIFISGLRKFKRHTLYTNIVNDMSAVYYTTGIAKTDPYRDIENVTVNYLDGWDKVILDPANPYTSKAGADVLSLRSTGLKTLQRLPLLMIVAIFTPMFLANSVLQTVRSSSRIKLHETGKAGLKLEDYRLPLWINEVRNEVEETYEVLNNEQGEDFLAHESDDASSSSSDGEDVKAPEAADRRTMRRERRLSTAEQPTLALSPPQFDMIDALDALEWRKYPVWIHNDRHSHAAIIVRWDKKSFDEGHVVLKHFAQDEFLI